MPAPIAVAAGLVLGSVAGSAMSRLARGLPALRRSNFRGREVALTGAGTALAVVSGAAIVAIVESSDAARRSGLAAALAGLAALLLGLADDLRGDTHVKGLRGHLRALAHGRLTSGSVKLLGIALAGLLAGSVLRDGAVDVVVAGALVAGCANLANLLDLRPGRALKVVLLAAVIAAVGAPDGVAATSWWLAGACVAAAPADLRERTMLGDAGANALGAVVGVVLVARGGDGAATPILLGIVVAATLLSEVVSYSRVIARVPPLRWADGLGRISEGPVARGGAP